MRSVRWMGWIAAVLIALLGAVYLVLGIWLITLHGSVYYAPAGLVLLAVAVLVVGRPRWALLLYLAFLVGSVVWTMVDVGLDGWQWMPRLLAFAALGVWLAIAAGIGTPHRWLASAMGAVSTVLLIAIFGLGWRTTQLRTVQYAAVANAAPSTDHDNDWRYYGRTPAGQRFSPAAQLTPDNVAKLEPAWTFHTGDTMRKGEDKAGREFNFEDTPIKLGNRLFLCTPIAR